MFCRTGRITSHENKTGEYMCIRHILAGFLLAVLLLPAAIAQETKRSSRLVEDLPENRQDTGLTGEFAAEAARKAGLLSAITGVECKAPTLRYSTVPLSALLGKSDPVQESEVWYFHCPEISPVLVHYRRIKGEISNIHVHEFETFLNDLPLRRLATRRNTKTSVKEFPRDTALYEAVCFGLLSEELAQTVNSKTPRLSARSESREDRQMCLRMQACNAVEPELDILQDISLKAGDDNREFAGFVENCNKMSPRALIAAEPELAYGLMQIIDNLPELVEQHAKPAGGGKGK